MLLRGLVSVSVQSPQAAFLNFPFRIPVVNRDAPVFLVRSVSNGPVALILTLITVTLFNLLFGGYRNHGLTKCLYSLLIKTILFDVVLT